MPRDFLTPGPEPLLVEWNFPVCGMLGKTVADLRSTIHQQADLETWMPPGSEEWGTRHWRTTGKKGTQDAIPVWVSYEIDHGRVIYVELSSDEEISVIRVKRNMNELVVTMIPRAQHSENARMWGRFAVERVLSGDTSPLPAQIQAFIYC